MQIFKAFFLNLRRQYVSILMYFGIFSALAILFTSTGQDQNDTMFKDTKIKLSVIDRDNSQLSRSLYDYLNDRHTLVELKDDKEVMTDELFYRNVEYILIINEGFEMDMQAGNMENVLENIKIPGNVNGYFVDTQVDQYLKTLSAYIHTGVSDEKAAELTLQSANISPEVTLQKGETTNSTRSSTYYFFIYVPYIFICILTVGLGSMLSVFRNKELDSRIRSSSLSLTKQNTHLTLCCISFSLVCWTLFMGLAAILYNEAFFSVKGLWYMANSFMFLLIAMSITFLVSTMFTESNVLNMISNVLGLGLSFLGGVFVPLEFLSDSVIKVSQFLPTYWYIKCNTIIDVYNGSSIQIEKMLTSMGIELISAIAIFAVAMVIIKVKSVRSA